jgi:3',5'-cyclic AMP phosphodiesterase CpdA
MEPLRFIHISDTHIGPTDDFTLQIVNTAEKTKQLINSINSLTFKPSFVVHTGDITASPDKESYEHASQIFRSLKHPIYFVTGNHDRSSLIHQYLQFPSKQDLTTNKELLTYTFDQNGIHFVVVDGRASDEMDPMGQISDEQMDILSNELKKDYESIILFIHYPAFSVDCPWVLERMLLVNGEDFHNLIVKTKGKVKSVFLGHVHRSVQVIRDGILYLSAASTCFNFGINPDETKPLILPIGTPSYNLVTITNNSVIVKNYVLS